MQILLTYAIFSCGLSQVTLTEFMHVDFFEDVRVFLQALVNPLFHYFIVHLHSIVIQFEPGRFQFLCLTIILMIERLAHQVLIPGRTPISRHLSGTRALRSPTSSKR